MIFHDMTSARFFAPTSLNQMGWISETTPTKSRQATRYPVWTSLASQPKLPLQRYARTRRASSQPDWAGDCDLSTLNYILTSNNNLLHPAPSLGGETHSYGVGGGRWRLRLASPPPGSVPEGFRALHSATKETQPMATRKLTSRVHFQQPPDVGFVLMREGQRYELVAHEPHIRRDGLPTTLLIWRSHCCDCGVAFEVVTGLVANGYFNRRCPDHHRPGRAVTMAGQKRRQRFLKRNPMRRKFRV